jgi:hypothetical protein
LSAFCESCGFRLEAGDTFCSGCGAKVDAPGDSGDAVAELPTPTDPMPPVAEAGPAPEGNGAQSSPSPDIAEDQPEFGATIAAMPLAEDEVADEAQPAPAEDADPAQADILPETDDDALADETLAAGEQSAWYPDEAPKRKSRAPIWTAGIIAIIAAVGGAGYVYRDQVMAYAAKAGISLGTDTAGGAEGGAEVAIPRVAGKYTAFLMDQDIEIEFEGEPAFLAQSKGTARYLNTVNGGRCVSRLVAIESGGIGGSTDSKVLFSQQPKEGEPPCGQDIPMQIDIDRQAMEKDGRVKRLVIEWQSAETREVLMSGTLEAKE